MELMSPFGPGLILKQNNGDILRRLNKTLGFL